MDRDSGEGARLQYRPTSARNHGESHVVRPKQIGTIRLGRTFNQ